MYAKTRKHGKQIATYWFRLDPSQRPPRGNFGDEITPLIVQHIFGYECTWAPPEECELAGAGSIIEVLLATKGANRPVLWGTGFMKEKGDSDPVNSRAVEVSESDFEFAALRGHYSRKRVEDSREIPVGDPGLLASQLLLSMPRKKYKLGVIPHMIDAGVPEIDWLRAQAGVTIINAINDPREIITQAAECHFIVSSSLHGLIIADSLKIPNAHIKFSNAPLIGGPYKFIDYYSAFMDTLRYSPIRAEIPPPGNSIGSIIKEIEEVYRYPDDLDQVTSAIIKSFPL